MNYKKSLLLLSSATLLTSVTPPINLFAEEGVKPTKPNILFLFSDDHSTAAISAYGNSQCETPNIDKIANEGAVLLNNTCANSICGPSRANVLTGKHSHLNGMKTNMDSFNPKQQTFPKILQDTGYSTALIGKWHLKNDPHGFDYWDIMHGQGWYYNPDFYGTKGSRRIEGYNTDIVGDLSLQWLEEHLKEEREKPFLLMAQFKAPHRNWAPAPRHYNLYNNIEFPLPETYFEDYTNRPDYFAKNEMRIADHLIMNYDLKVPNTLRPDKLGRLRPNYELARMNPAQKRAWNKAYKKEYHNFMKTRPKGKELAKWKYQRYIKDYLRCIAAVDENVGRLLKFLEENNLDENTIVIYSSDQSFFLGEHGLYDKRWMYKESLAMPFMIRYPKKISAGQRLETVTQNIDFAPTLLDFAGLSIPNDIQGESFAPLLTGEGSFSRKAIYYHYYEKGEHNVPRHEGVYDGHYKLISFYDHKAWELYDLEKDPNELKNQYNKATYKEIQKKMHETLNNLKEEYKVTPP